MRGDGRGEKGKPVGLQKLPPGRHGLPREYVTRNQRERLAAGIIASVAEHGFHETTITQIAAAAGVSRRTFYSYFGSKEECFFDTYEMLERHLGEAVAEAGAAEADWARAVRARVATLLDWLAANPDLVRFSMVAPPAAGGEVADRYRSFLERLVAALIGAVPADRAHSAPSPSEKEVLAGGLSALLVQKVSAGEGEDLPQLLPEILELLLTPSIGRQEAAEISRMAGPAQ